jgi:hypothetical protein
MDAECRDVFGVSLMFIDPEILFGSSRFGSHPSGDISLVIEAFSAAACAQTCFFSFLHNYL